MDYEKMLRAYMLHVCYEEGTAFANSWDIPDLIENGLSQAEAERVTVMADEQYEAYKTAIRRLRG